MIGYEEIDIPDIKISNDLLDEFKDHISGFNSAIDMGAGIGRISKELLIPRFKEVDLLEPANNIHVAEKNLGK